MNKYKILGYEVGTYMLQSILACKLNKRLVQKIRFLSLFFFLSQPLQAGYSLRPLVSFLDRQQAKLTEAYADAQNSPACVPMTLEEKKAFSEKVLDCKWNSESPTQRQQMEELDDLFFHMKSVQLKNILNCKKTNVDCFISSNKDLRDVADYYVAYDLYYSNLFLKDVTGTLSNEEKANIDQIVPDKTVLDIIDKTQICKIRNQVLSFFKEQRSQAFVEKHNADACIDDVKYFLKIIVYNGYITRQIDDFIDNQTRLEILEELASQKVEGKCQARAIIYRKIREGLSATRHKLENEENKIARSCIRSETDNSCFYKPTYQSKHYLINVGHPSPPPGASKSEPLDPSIIKKYFCHLQRIYGTSYDELNMAISDTVIPIFDLVFYYRAMLGGFFSKAISQSPTLALSAAQLSKKAIMKNPITKSAKLVANKTGDVILFAGALIETNKISQACVRKLRSTVGTGVNVNWDTNNCSCRNQHISPITDKASGDCQTELFKVLIQDSMAPLTAIKDSLFMVDSVKSEGLPQAFDAMLNKNLSKTLHDFKNLATPQKTTQLTQFIKQYEENKDCP